MLPTLSVLEPLLNPLAELRGKLTLQSGKLPNPCSNETGRWCESLQMEPRDGKCHIQEALLVHRGIRDPNVVSKYLTRCEVRAKKRREERRVDASRSEHCKAGRTSRAIEILGHDGDHLTLRPDGRHQNISSSNALARTGGGIGALHDLAAHGVSFTIDI
jgi:hypothetical protein